jgi:tetratricopeptide (TPR) repeat protein
VTINYNLYRFGYDEFAVGHLINGDFPDDDEERWRIVEAPGYHIQRLLDEHFRAQAALRKCRDSGKPFALFLRSFSFEYRGIREGMAVGGQVSLISLDFQQALEAHLEEAGVPIIKLHGGSDGFHSTLRGDVKILSTHADNWQTIAAKLVQGASIIVFLVSGMTPGVMQEFDLIRTLGQSSRCIVLLADPTEAPERASGDVESLRAQLADFSTVFELKSTPIGAKQSFPTELESILAALVRAGTTSAPLEQAINAQFTYLEPGFLASEDYVSTETYMWRALRLLRVMFDDTYWAALKAHDVPFRHFTFPGPWKIAHQIYGLAIATADFRAIRESLRYLSLLYIWRGADFALLIDMLANQYQELTEQIFKSGPPDTESRFTSTRDPLTFPATTDTAIAMLRVAATAGGQQDAETANYLYQSALICALRSTDGEERERRWITANICADWAKLQAHSPLVEWAVANYLFALKLFRDLASADPDRYAADVAQCLNNLGTVHFQRRDFPAASAAFGEALAIRRGLPPDSKGYAYGLSNSLVNLALVRVEMGEHDAARALYSESIALSQKRLSTEPGAIVDLTRQQTLLSVCLSKIPGATSEGLAYAQRAAANLSSVSNINPENDEALRTAINEAVRANGGSAAATHDGD